MHVTIKKTTILIVSILLNGIVVFSQEKKDVYFILEDNNCEYSISYLMYGKEIGYIHLADKKKQEYYQKKVKEAKENGSYDYDPESGRDNLGIHIPKLTFEVLSRKDIVLDSSQLHKLNLVDYEWVTENTWRAMPGQQLPFTGKETQFKDVYFLSKIDDGINTYRKSKVIIAIIAH